jgi:hypothetical protein
MKIIRLLISNSVEKLANSLKVKNHQKISEISCINGIRCALTILVFGFHCVFFRVNSLQIVKNFQAILTTNKIMSEFLISTINVVDAFFVLAGILYTRAVATKIRK